MLKLKSEELTQQCLRCWFMKLPNKTVSCILVIVFMHGTGHPSTPAGPIEFKDINVDTVTLKWNPPDDSGGVPVSKYVVEISESNHQGFKVCRLSENRYN